MAPRASVVGPARRAAFQVLQRVFEDGAYADRVLRSAGERLDSRDRALAQRLSFGAVQRVRTLDHAIETLGRRRVARLDPPVRAALRLGAYQLGFVDGVPRYAAVNESVELVRAAGLERAVAFTNAVLRRLSEGMRPLLAALPETTSCRSRSQALVPGLDCRVVVARSRLGRRDRPHESTERARRDRREADQRRDRRNPGRDGSGCMARRSHRRGRARRRPDLAPKPGVAARGARRWCGRRRPRPRSLRRSRRQGHDARGRGRRGRGERCPRT